MRTQLLLMVPNSLAKLRRIRKRKLNKTLYLVLRIIKTLVQWLKIMTTKRRRRKRKLKRAHFQFTRISLACLSNKKSSAVSLMPF